jgi:predicted transcriptional regulator
VRAIQQVLNQSRPTGYTTVLKLMQIMTEKGLVERDETCRPQLYRARYSQQQTQRQLLGDLMNRAFGGSVKALVLQALAAKKSSPEELEAMESFWIASKEAKMTAIAQALSAALLDFVWQGLLAAFLLWTALFVLRNRSARARYAASCVALA